MLSLYFSAFTCCVVGFADLFSDFVDGLLKFDWGLWSIDKLFNHLSVDVASHLTGYVDGECCYLLVNNVFLSAKEFEDAYYLLFGERLNLSLVHFIFTKKCSKSG